MYVVIICFPVCDFINFEINYSYQFVFLHDQNVRIKMLICLLKKEALAQVFSCEFCEISKKTFFREQLWANASVKNKKSF